MDLGTHERLQSWLEVSSTTLSHAWQQAREQRYRHAQLGSRALAIPEGALYTVQSHIQRHLLRLAPVSTAAHGGVPRRSIVSHAACHLPRARAVLTMDIRDAYGQITPGQLRATWRRAFGRAWKEQGLDGAARREMASILARLTVTPRGLPTGAPTSATLFNLAVAPFDAAMTRLVHEKLGDRGRYSRYLDDLAVSSSSFIPRNFERHIRRALHTHKIGQANPDKTRRADRQRGEVPCILGLIDDGKGLALHPSRVLDLTNTLRGLFHIPADIATRRALGIQRFLHMIHGPDRVPRALLAQLAPFVETSP